MDEDYLGATLKLTNQDTTLKEDLVILYRTQNMHEPSIVMQKSLDYKEYAALLSFYPQFTETKEPITSQVDHDTKKIYKSEDEILITGRGEYIFILDCSGSMRGEAIEIAKSALEIFLRSLPVKSRFNIILFGSTYEVFEQENLEYNPETLKKALEYVKAVKANMKATEIYEPLKYAIRKNCTPGYPRNIFLLTDGHVKDQYSVINLIRENARRICVYTFGIGKSVSHELVKECALAGNGISQFASENEDVTPKVIKALSKACLASCLEIKIEWPESIKLELQTPANETIRNIYLDEPFIAFAIIKDLPEDYKEKKVILIFKDSIKYEEKKLEVELLGEVINGDYIYKGAAKNAIEIETEMPEEEKAKLSLKYSVLSNETSFLATKRNKKAVKTGMTVIKIPVYAKNGYRWRKPVSETGYMSFERKALKAINVKFGSSKAKTYSKNKRQSSDNIDWSFNFIEEKEVACFSSSPYTAAVSTASKIPPPSNYNIPKKSYKVIVECQDICGKWLWDASTFTALKVNESNSEKSIPTELNSKISDVKVLKEVWVTILALAMLEIKHANDIGAWKLIHQKGVQWLKDMGVNYVEVKKLGIAFIK